MDKKGYEFDGISVFKRLEEARNKGKKIKSTHPQKIDATHSGHLDTQLFRRKKVKTKDGCVILKDDTDRGW